MALSEFGLIKQFFDRSADGADGVRLGIGDDGAVLVPRPGMELVVAVDTLVDAVHFPSDMAPADIAWRALATNLSDLAAMAAQPRWFTLALSLPAADAQWLASFSAGLFELADSAGIVLVGGDTTRGPLTVSITVMGEVEAGAALTRGGARPGDLLFVSGSPGLAALGLQQFRDPAPDRDALERFCRPRARLGLGRSLRGVASAAIDVSDGLLADAGHIAERSAVGIRIDAARVPLAPALAALPREQALALALSGGDDYELCFTAPATAHDSVMAKAHNEGVVCTAIGEVISGEGVECDGMSAVATGYDHFRGTR